MHIPCSTTQNSSRKQTNKQTNKTSVLQARKMAQWLRAHTDFCITTCNSSSWESNTFFWPPQGLYTHDYVHTKTQKNVNIYFKNPLCFIHLLLSLPLLALETNYFLWFYNIAFSRVSPSFCCVVWHSLWSLLAFLVLNNLLLTGCSKIYSFIHLLKDFPVTFKFWQLCKVMVSVCLFFNMYVCVGMYLSYICIYVYVCVCVCVCVCVHMYKCACVPKYMRGFWRKLLGVSLLLQSCGVLGIELKWSALVASAFNCLPIFQAPKQSVYKILCGYRFSTYLNKYQ
jgi:hypothetical protein